MNRKRVGAAVVISGIIVGAYKLFIAASKLQFGEIKITGKEIKLDGLKLVLSLPVINTDEKTSLKYDGFEGALWYGKHKLADINTYENYVLKAKTTTATSVKISIDYFSLGAEIRNMIKTGDFLNALKIEGLIKSEGLRYKISQKVL